jgi:hypothetical protein
MDGNKPPFEIEIRAVMECGWNIFNRNGFSDHPRDISFNRDYIDYLSQAGINWDLVFWTNARAFDDAWNQAVEYAHSVDVKLARTMYGFGGGGPENSMAEPDAPVGLLRDSPTGPKTAVCPHEEEARAWMSEVVVRRLEPNLDGLIIEPASQIRRNCVCPRCRALAPREWDVFVLNHLADVAQKHRPEIVLGCHLNRADPRESIETAAAELRRLSPSVQHVIAWGQDDDHRLVEWLDAEPRFTQFAKMGRVLLFPGDQPSRDPLEERVGRVFRWCRWGAERGKKAFVFDYRIFGGREFRRAEQALPVTRRSDRIPASLALIGAAMQNPAAEPDEQRELIARLRHETDWDLDDPLYFYRGVRE